MKTAIALSMEIMENQKPETVGSVSQPFAPELLRSLNQALRRNTSDGATARLLRPCGVSGWQPGYSIISSSFSDLCAARTRREGT
jgi:hypothetical protein